MTNYFYVVAFVYTKNSKDLEIIAIAYHLYIEIVISLSGTDPFFHPLCMTQFS